jgi:dTDP-4-dehydrorhamnose reductase
MKKVLITGSNGLLGQKLVDLYRHIDDVFLIATARGSNRHPEKNGYIYQEMDITNETQVHEVILKYQPYCVINTAAMTQVDDCETNREMCDLLNISAVSYLIDACNLIGAHFIHLSTDFIFDGKSGPYTEEDQPNPLSYYGLSKLKAENLIIKKAKKWSIARTVLVYGLVNDMSRSNIVLWAKQNLEKGQPMQVVHDQWRSPTLAEDLAMGCRLIEQKNVEGIFNICGKDQMNIYEIVCRVAKYFNLPTKQVEKVDSKTFKQPAKRPPITGLTLDKSREVLGYEPHTFEEGIALIMSQTKN